MYAFSALASLAILASRAYAALYFTSPVSSTTCTAGQSCLASWTDDSVSPHTSSIGNCNVGIYTGNMQAVQTLPSVDVSTSSSLPFVPDPATVPTGQYFLVFSSTGITYQALSDNFTINGVSGTSPAGGSSTPNSPAPSTSEGSGATTPPTGSTPSAGTVAPGGATTFTVATNPTGGTPTPTNNTTTASKAATSASVAASASASASATNAAGRVGSSTSLGGLAALFVLSAVLTF